MKIAFTGKGGSGKTTISSQFALQMAREIHTVLALDADINQHLSQSIGWKGLIESMGLRFDDIKHHLRGSNTIFTDESMHKTTPPGNGSQLILLKDTDWFMKTFTQKVNGVHVAGAGEIPDGNIGIKCYHGLNGAIELVLSHMIDQPDDIVIVDMTAGADAFSSSLFTKVDALVLVVEPTLKSLSVYNQFQPHAKEYDIPLFVVGNKIESDNDREFIENVTGSLTASFSISNYVKKRERGQAMDKEYIEDTLQSELHRLYDAVIKVPRNWAEVERRSYVMHRRNVQNLTGGREHIDPVFSLKNAAEKFVL